MFFIVNLSAPEPGSPATVWVTSIQGWFGGASLPGSCYSDTTGTLAGPVFSSYASGECRVLTPLKLNLTDHDLQSNLLWGDQLFAQLPKANLLTFWFPPSPSLVKVPKGDHLLFLGLWATEPFFWVPCRGPQGWFT